MLKTRFIALGCSAVILAVSGNASAQTLDAALTKVDAPQVESAIQPESPDHVFERKLRLAERRITTGTALLGAGGVLGFAGVTTIAIAIDTSGDLSAAVRALSAGLGLTGAMIPFLISGGVVFAKGKRQRRNAQRELNVALNGAGASATLRF